MGPTLQLGAIGNCQIAALVDPEATVVYSIGTLYGAWPDGVAFEGGTFTLWWVFGCSLLLGPLGWLSALVATVGAAAGSFAVSSSRAWSPGLEGRTSKTNSRPRAFPSTTRRDRQSCSLI